MKKMMTFIVGILGFILASCSDKKEDDIIAGKLPFNTPIVEWGATKEKVKQYMKEYTLYSETNTGLFYLGKDTEQSINYRFSEDKLNAAIVILVQPDESKLNFSNIFKNFDLLPTQMNGAPGYMNTNLKTFGTYESRTNSNGKVFFISWVEVKGLVEGE